MPLHADHNAPPLNPLPPVVWLMVAPVVLVELALTLGERGLVGGREAIGWGAGAFADWAFFGTVLDGMLANGRFPPEELARFVTYPFVHGSFTHAVFAVVFLLALGKFVGEVFRAWAVLTVFLGASVVAALAYGLALDTPQPLYGALPGAYGLIGALTYILWARLGALRADRRRAFLLIGFLMGFQLVIGLIYFIFRGWADWSWLADLTGFAAGFALSFVVRPGGWQAVLVRLRQP